MMHDIRAKPLEKKKSFPICKIKPWKTDNLKISLFCIGLKKIVCVKISYNIRCVVQSNLLQYVDDVDKRRNNNVCEK